MRKKYLSALLFGALLFASAGTFTSCKDYDDDIDGLRTEITDLKSAITELQNAVQKGKYVTAVSGNGNVITFTFSDGSTTPITVETESGEASQTVTIGEDGEVIINGEGTGYYTTKTPTEAEVEVGLVKKGANGTWEVLGEDGEYTDTKIPVSGVTVSGSEAEGYTFTIVNANGESQTVKLPSAASAITELTLGDKLKQNGTLFSSAIEKKFEYNNAAITIDANDFLISHEKFTFTPTNSVKDEIKSASDWMGNKTIPANGSYIYSSPTSVDLRIDPVDVPAENIQFYLTNTKNENLNPVVLNAVGDPNGDGPMDANQANGRATVAGNGLWVLSMANQTVAGNQNEATWKAVTDAGSAVFAVNANNAFRSKYELNVKAIDPQDLTDLYIKGESEDDDKTFDFKIEEAQVTVDGVTGPYKSDYEWLPTLTGKDDQNITFKTNKAYKVEAVEASALYDMYLTADKSDCDVYGLSFDQDKHTFTIGKNPDVSSIPAEFDLMIYTVSNKGEVKKTVVTIVLNSEISAAAEYSLIDHNVNYADPTDNLFYIDLATMKTALGDNLNQWMQNVDLAANAITYEFFTDEDCKKAVSSTSLFGANNVFKADIVAKNTKDAGATADRNNANYIRILVDNDDVKTYNDNASNTNKLQLDKTYYVKVSFQATAANGAGKLNSIVVPVEFHAPALADLFTVKQGYVEDNVINAYFYKAAGVTIDEGNGVKTPYTDDYTSVDLTFFFSQYVSDAQVVINNDEVIVDNKRARDLFYFKTNNIDIDGNGTEEAYAATFGEKGKDYITALDFTLDNNNNSTGIDKNGQPANGYGKAFTLDVTKDNFEGWKYTQDGDNEYSFQMRLLSPIYEGEVRPVEGNTITINGNDFVKGAHITNEDIMGYDYNDNDYSVVPDATEGVNGNEPNATWYENPQIESVIPSVDKDGYMNTAEAVKATMVEDEYVPGYFLIRGNAVSNTVTVDMPVTVTDAWGYKLNDSVSVTIVRNTTGE